MCVSLLLSYILSNIANTSAVLIIEKYTISCDVRHTVHAKLFLLSGGSLVSDKSKPSVAITAQLLGLNEEELKRSLTSRVMITTKGGTVGTIIKLACHISTISYCVWF